MARLASLAVLDCLPVARQSVVAHHVLTGLGRAGLIQNSYGFMSTERHEGRDFTWSSPDRFMDGAVEFSPTALGFELFLWANGYPDSEPGTFFDWFDETKIRLPDGLALPEGDFASRHYPRSQQRR